MPADTPKYVARRALQDSRNRIGWSGGREEERGRGGVPRRTTKSPDVTIQIKRATKRHRPDDPDSIATEPISAGRSWSPCRPTGATPSSAEYYITCFRCINSFRDGSGHRRSGPPHNRGLAESARSNRFFRGGVDNETSSTIRTVRSTLSLWTASVLGRLQCMVLRFSYSAPVSYTHLTLPTIYSV